MRVPSERPTQDSIIEDVLPDGYLVRPVRPVGDDGGPDVDAAYAVVWACESRVNGTCESPRGETLEGLTDSEADPAGARLVLAPDGAPVGYLSVITDREARAVFVDAYAVDECGTGVTPTGLLGALVRAGLLRGAQLADDASGQWTVKFVAPDADTEYREAIVHEGLTPIRIFYRMRIGFEHQVLAPPLPEGVTIGVVRTDDERRLVHEVVDTSFADHWDHTPHSVESFISYATRAFGYDPSRWWLLRVDGVPAAVCVGSDEYREIGDGYIKWLGVLRDFRGQGLAKLLLRHSFHSYASNGYSGVRLGVDASSPTGATHLYKSVGMSPIETMHVYNHDVT